MLVKQITSSTPVSPATTQIRIKIKLNKWNQGLIRDQHCLALNSTKRKIISVNSDKTSAFEAKTRSLPFDLEQKDKQTTNSVEIISSAGDPCEDNRFSLSHPHREFGMLSGNLSITPSLGSLIFPFIKSHLLEGNPWKFAMQPLIIILLNDTFHCRYQTTLS